MRKLRERPLQIYLRPDQDSALRQMAAARGVSMAELVRNGVDHIIATAPVEDDPTLGLIGIGSGPGDLSTNHDYYIVQALMQESQSPMLARKPSRKTRPRRTKTRLRAKSLRAVK